MRFVSLMAAGFNLAEQNHAKYTKQHFWSHGLYSPKHTAHPYFTILDLEPRRTVQTTHQEVFNHKNLQKIITGRPSWDAHSWAMELPNSPDKIHIKVWCLVRMLIWNMELFWLWVQILGSAIIAGSVKSLPVDQDQQPRPEDVELAEVCGQTSIIILHILPRYLL